MLPPVRRCCPRRHETRPSPPPGVRCCPRRHGARPGPPSQAARTGFGPASLTVGPRSRATAALAGGRRRVRGLGRHTGPGGGRRRVRGLGADTGPAGGRRRFVACGATHRAGDGGRRRVRGLRRPHASASTCGPANGWTGPMEHVGTHPAGPIASMVASRFRTLILTTSLIGFYPPDCPTGGQPGSSATTQPQPAARAASRPAGGSTDDARAPPVGLRCARDASPGGGLPLR